MITNEALNPHSNYFVLPNAIYNLGLSSGAIATYGFLSSCENRARKSRDRYDRLSLSEKVRAGMELSELMKRLTGRNYPVFVDNMESIEDLRNVQPTGQVLMASCVKGAQLHIGPLMQQGNSQMPKAA